MSNYYQERMEADLREILAKVRTVSDLVEDQVEQAIRALLQVDRSLAARVVLGDRQVNRRIKQIDSLCHAFVVRHAPSERYLRRASAVLRLDVALERIGDYADSIGREVGRLSGPPPDSVAADFQRMTERARESLSRALRAFHEDDAELARERYEADEAFERTMAGLLRAGEARERPLDDIFGFKHVLHLLMRIFEQSDNIREQTLFALFGETPGPRVFRVLFVDERNDGASMMAEAYARRRYPASARYSSAGLAPASAPNDEVVRFLSGRGVEGPEGTPRSLRSVVPPEGHFHVVVLMFSNGAASLPPVPFRTTLVRWDLGMPSTPDSGSVDALYARVTARVDDLMVKLAGPDAS